MTAVTLYLIRAAAEGVPPTALELLSSVGGILGLPAVVLLILGYFLNKKGANKKLSLDERTVAVTERGQNVDEFNAQIATYKDLLDRQNLALEKAIAAVGPLELRVTDLETADAAKSEELDAANNKIGLLRSLFQSYIDRTGVPLTVAEQAVFDDTIPSPRLRKAG